MRTRLCVLACLFVLLALVLLAPHSPVEGFSGEDPLCQGEYPQCIWHHEIITEQAARNNHWSEAAVQELAWHADYVDSYLYNPLWWAAGGLSRYKAALATSDELEKLHFDNLFSTDHVRYMWRRYTAGTVAGLVWASQHNGGDVSAARNIVGASLHAIEDFYSHSNWVDDPRRRPFTWFTTPQEQTELMPLWTGSYDVQPHLGIKPHGEIVPACTVLSQSAIHSLMTIVDPNVKTTKRRK